MCRTLLIAMLLCMVGTELCAQEEGDTREELQSVFMSLRGKALQKAVKKLGRKFDIAFSYRSGALDGIAVPNFAEAPPTVERFLRDCLENSMLDLEVIGGTYVFFQKESTDANSSLGRKDFSLSGLVRDAKTGEGLPFATLGIEGTSLSSTSNTDGKFTLLRVPSDTAVIVVRYLGYKPFRMQLDGESALGPLEVDMESRGRELPSVQITAQKEKIFELGKQPSQLTFSPMEIERLPNLGENDIFAALSLLPGMSSASDLSSGLRIRASESDENLVLFDGMPIYHQDHFFGFLSAFNSNVIKNVQIHKANYSARYGSRTGGLINIQGIDGNKKDLGLLVEAGVLSTNVLLELPLVEDKASFVFAYRRAYTDVLRSPTYTSMFNNLFNSSIPNVRPMEVNLFDGESVPDYSYFDLNAKLHFKPTDKDDIAISFYRGLDDLSIAFRAEAGGITRSSTDAVAWGNTGGSLKWSRKWNERLFSYANIALTEYSSDLNADIAFLANEDELLSRRIFQQNTSLQDRTLRLDNNYEINPNARLQFGTWLTQYRVGLQAQDQDFIFTDSVQAASLGALYADYEWSYGRWNLRTGLRAVAHEGEQEPRLEPRVSLGFDVMEHLSLKASAGRHHQMMRRLNERSLYFSIPETWAVAGQAEVPVLRSDQFVLGATYSRNGWEADVEFYYKEELGTVDFLMPEFGIASGSLDQFAIGGRRQVRGIDFLVKKNFSRQYAFLTYTFLDSRSTYEEINGGESFSSMGVARHQGSAVYNFQASRWDFSLSFVWSSGLPYTPVLGTFVLTLESGEQQQFVSLGDVNSRLTPWTHRLDLGAGYTIPLRKGILKFGLNVYNAYNNDNVRFIDYFEIPDAESNFFSLGRREVIGFGILPSLFVRLRI